MTMVGLLVMSVLLAVTLTGCGGSKSSSSSIAVSNSGGQVSRADCRKLGSFMQDLALADSGLAPPDYNKMGAFFDNFKPPGKIKDDTSRVKDIVDTLASAYDDAGVKPGDEPVGDQVDQIQKRIQYSDDEKAQNRKAFASLTNYNDNGCD